MTRRGLSFALPLLLAGTPRRTALDRAAARAAVEGARRDLGHLQVFGLRPIGELVVPEDAQRELARSTAPTLATRDRRDLRTSDRLLTDSLAQGLVRFDAAGQIESGIAERWIVIDDGRSFEHLILHRRGSPENALSAADVEYKFRHVVAACLSSADIERAIALIPSRRGRGCSEK